MDSPFWPGDDRAGDTLSPRSFLEAMVAVEAAWIDRALEVPDVDLDAEAGGNAVIGLVDALRSAHPGVDVHTGLTSQDVVDSALMLLLRDAVDAIHGRLTRASEAIRELDASHGGTPLIARTLTQWALPITFGHRLDAWHTGLAEACEDLEALTFPVQVGGPVGLLEDDRDLAARLGLAPSRPWHTNRRPITRIGDALTAVTDACGHIARDVLTMARSDVAELSEGTGGGSSSMPHKANPVLSVLVRRATLTTPQLAATLHLCAADQVEERADGAWHAEWDTLRVLVRRTLVAADQTADLLSHLRVNTDRMRSNLAAAQSAREERR